ncbi:MAG: hypothetical protein JZU72_00785 [Chlorobium phaeobacteroides]|jgi:hypothetical protein|nr:hypothetical protein [Chlorobium phaeobacteroides]
METFVMPSERDSGDILRILTVFADNISDSDLEELLDSSTMKPDEQVRFREKYRTMRDDLERVCAAYRDYELHERDVNKKVLEEFLLLLQQGPEQRAKLIHQLALVLVRAEKLFFLDSVLMSVLNEIWPKVKRPKTLPAFSCGIVPSEAEWPKYRLEDIYDEKSLKAQNFWNDAYFLVMPDIEAATDALKKKKKELDSIVKAMDGCMKIIGLLTKGIGLLA